jgi:hypothetical protein
MDTTQPTVLSPLGGVEIEQLEEHNPPERQGFPQPAFVSR